MKVKLNSSVHHKGQSYNEGDTLTVNAQLAGAWIQTGIADVFSKKSVRTSKPKQTNASGGESKPSRSSSEGND